MSNKDNNSDHCNSVNSHQPKKNLGIFRHEVLRKQVIKLNSSRNCPRIIGWNAIFILCSISIIEVAFIIYILAEKFDIYFISIS